MRIGAVFPQTEIGNDPAAIRDWAQAVEDLGYRHVLAYDHVLGAGVDTRAGWSGYSIDDPFHEIFVLLGYLAAVTSTVELVTGVLVLPQRQTALVAKQTAEVDVLSRGRLRLGVGVGWNYVEYGALGESFSNRGARSEEQVAVLRQLWADRLVTYTGPGTTSTTPASTHAPRAAPSRSGSAATRRRRCAGWASSATGGSHNVRPTRWHATCSSEFGGTRERPAAILHRSVSNHGCRSRRCRRASGRSSPPGGASWARRTCV